MIFIPFGCCCRGTRLVRCVAIPFPILMEMFGGTKYLALLGLTRNTCSNFVKSEYNGIILHTYTLRLKQIYALIVRFGGFKLIVGVLDENE